MKLSYNFMSANVFEDTKCDNGDKLQLLWNVTDRYLVMFSLLHSSLSECESGPLGMANGSIPDSSITASSYMKFSLFDRLPEYARLGGSRYWASDGTDSNPWIQVDLGSNHTVTGLQTEGDYNSILGGGDQSASWIYRSESYVYRRCQWRT